MEMTGRAGGRILIGRSDGIGRIVFNKPEKMNAMSLDMWQGLHEALDAFASDGAVRVVVLSGAGDRAFVSGADISEFGEKRSTPEAVEVYNRTYLEADEALRTLPKPSIAAIRGFCVGGGLGIAMACDIRICSTGSRLGIPAAKLGLGYGLAGTRRLVDIAGPAAASEVLFSARLFEAGEALGMRLVNRVVAEDVLDDEVAAMAGRIAANAPLTVATAKQAIRAAGDPQPGDAERIAAMVAACYASEDYAEGRRAFAERRLPKFRGV